MIGTAPRAAAAEAGASFRSTLAPLLALALALAVGFTLMGSFSTVQEGAKAELGLSDYSLGLIQGLSAALPLALFSIPIGIAVDRYNRVRLLIALSVLWTLGTAATAFASGVPILFAARMMTGTGAAGALTAALSLVGDYCAPVQRGRGMLIVTLGKSLGMAAGFALAGALYGLFAAGRMAGAFGAVAPWRGTHHALAILGLALMLPLFLLREPKRREVAAGTHAPFKAIAGELWARRSFLIPLFAGQVSVVMADAAAAIWAAPALSRGYGLQPQDFAGWLGALIFSTGIVGAILGGPAADAGHKSGKRGGLLIGAVIAAGFGIPAALFPLSPNVPGFAVAIGLLMLCGTVTGLITSVALTVLIPNEMRGLCIGAFISIAGLIGFGLAPAMVAAVSALLGGESQLANALAIVGVGVSIVSFLAFLQAMRRVPLDATENLSERS